MRLRQICLVARDLETTSRALCETFAIEVAYRDPEVGTWGLHNVVVPVGGEFLEIVSPKEAGTSAERYIDRRGGDGGYMVILHCDDALAARARVAARGVRDVWRIDRPGYVATQFHPRDCGGVLLTMDSVPGVADRRTPMADWPPAGDDWRDRVRTTRVTGLAGVTIQAADPEATARLWSDLIDSTLRRDGSISTTQPCASFRSPTSAGRESSRWPCAPPMPLPSPTPPAASACRRRTAASPSSARRSTWCSPRRRPSAETGRARYAVPPLSAKAPRAA